MKRYYDNISSQEVFSDVFLNLFSGFKDFYDDEEYDDIVNELDLYSLAQVVQHKMQKLRTYTANTDYDFALQFQSKPIIKDSACMLYSENDSASATCVCETYNTELWITEELDFMLVKSFTVEYPSEDCEYSTTYRTIEKHNPVASDLPFSLEDLIEELNNFASIAFDGRTPICEI